MDAGLNILLIGCGKMGGAILRGLHAGHARSSPPRCVVIDPNAQNVVTGVEVYRRASDLSPGFHPHLVLLAVKPQQMAAVLAKHPFYNNAVYLSIAAGVTTDRLIEMLGSRPAPIVRSMPNLPASVGAGIAAAYATAAVTSDQKQQCQRVLNAIGETVWLDHENDLNAVTALSGSGPAYVFALCEAMEQAGVKLGLPAPLAAQLARQTIFGSGQLLKQSGDSAHDLRVAVTSPGGTTEAALGHLLSDPGLSQLIERAMQAACARSKELAQ